MEYTELQITSNFSFLRGASHPEELVDHAADLGYTELAITDRNSFAGIVRGHAAATTTQNACPVAGCIDRGVAGGGDDEVVGALRQHHVAGAAGGRTGRDHDVRARTRGDHAAAIREYCVVPGPTGNHEGSGSRHGVVATAGHHRRIATGKERAADSACDDRGVSRGNCGWSGGRVDNIVVASRDGNATSGRPGQHYLGLGPAGGRRRSKGSADRRGRLRQIAGRLRQNDSIAQNLSDLPGRAGTTANGNGRAVRPWYCYLTHRALRPALRQPRYPVTEAPELWTGSIFLQLLSYGRNRSQKNSALDPSVLGGHHIAQSRGLKCKTFRESCEAPPDYRTVSAHKNESMEG